MLLYFIGFIILCIITFFCYIRLKYRFWALQPVFHFYDLYYWFVSVGIIRSELPDKNRYTNLKNIVTKRFENVGENDLKHVLTLIQLNYFTNDVSKENKYLPKKENVVPYFVGHSNPAYISYYVEPELLLDNKTGKTIEENKIIGIITGRPLHVKINCSRKDAIFDVYYIDYLCVHKSWRKKNIAPQLIQTHEYNQSHNNRKISVSLFKREEELTGIIPLTVYKTYCFPLTKFYVPEPLEPRFTLLTGDKQNIYYFYNFLQEKEVIWKWSIMIYPDISNIIELVATNNLFIKMLLIDGNICAVYIFRKTCLYIEKGKEVLCLIASICSSELTKKEFNDCFNVAFWSIIKDNQNFGFLTVEDISDNTSIINDICINTHPVAISPMAYFFYNFAYSPFKSEKCLIIN